MTPSLRELIEVAARPLRSRLWDADGYVAVSDLLKGGCLGNRLEALNRRSVLVATRHQITAALALIELDGIARRLVLCPPGLPVGDLATIVATADVDAVVSDLPSVEINALDLELFVPHRLPVKRAGIETHDGPATEWVLLTSGTSGTPKLVVHTLATLAGAVQPSEAATEGPVWSTFYDIRRFGGLQVLLRALIGGGSLVLSGAQETLGAFVARAGRHGVTHFTGTPSHWRRALMSHAVPSIAPRYVRLSGEIADQVILDGLRARFGGAAVVHAFASTAAGVAFEVGDGQAGFPASLLGRAGAVEMKVEDGSLRIRSQRTGRRYLDEGGVLADVDGFVDTGDMVEQRGERCYFIGRRGGIINVGGLKVHPEEVEAVINRHPRVQMSRVMARRNPITGAVVVADVLARELAGEGAPMPAADLLKSEIILSCRQALAAHKVPATIRLVPSLDIAESGKLARPIA